MVLPYEPRLPWNQFSLPAGASEPDKPQVRSNPASAVRQRNEGMDEGECPRPARSERSRSRGFRARGELASIRVCFPIPEMPGVSSGLKLQYRLENRKGARGPHFVYALLALLPPARDLLAGS